MLLDDKNSRKCLNDKQEKYINVRADKQFVSLQEKPVNHHYESF